MSARVERAIWDPVEQLPRERLRELQFERLRATVDRVQPPGAPALRSLEDLRRLPFSWKSDLRDNYPFGLLAVPRERLVRVHASSGTHGKPTVVGYTRADLDAWAELMARSLTMAGVRAGMVVHNAVSYGLFTGGLGFHAGAELIGATVVPASGGFSARQAMLMSDLGAQVLASTPSYALVISQAVRDAGVELQLELGLFGGEPFTEAMREQIELELGLRAVATYGLSEMCGPGVAGECHAREGLHVQEDHFLTEVVDPDTGEPVAEGEEGELVFTTLVKEALPLIRYRTGDIGSVDGTPCECGRTFARVTGLRGRRDDMLIVRGVNLFPSNVEHLLLGVEEVAPHYRLIVDREGPMDELTVECEPASDGVDRETLAARLEHLLRERTGIRIAVAVVDPGAVPRSEGKAVRVVDRRGRLARAMDWKLELVQVPVSDVDRAIAFYTEQAGFNLDHDHQVSDDLRFVQLTPPGSGCSISMGPPSGMEPGSLQGLQLVVPDIEAAHAELSGRGVEVGEIQDFPWGSFVFFKDPDGNGWAVQQVQPRNA